MGAADLAQLTLSLCAVPSPTGQEAPLADLIEARCRALGGVDVLRVGHSVVARGPVLPGRPTVALLGHSDTVKPAARQDLGLFDGRVYGCGASDMKGGLSLMLTLLGEVAAPGRANLRCVFYDREEGPADESGILPLLEQGLLDGVDLGLCLEPTDGAVQAGCVGGLHARVTFLGQRAHSARPWQGRSAIYAALPYLQRLAALPRREVQLSGLTFYEVMNATMAHTDNSRNVIPDRFVVNVNYRFAPGKPLSQAEAELRALVAESAPDAPPGVQPEVEIVDRAPSGAVCLDQPLLREWIAASRLEVAAKQAWTDVARLSARGIAAVNFGPGETAQAHQENESIPVAALWAGYRALRALLGGAAGPAGAEERS